MRQGRTSTEELSAAFLFVLDLDAFTVQDIARGSGVAPATAGRYAKGWCRTGIATVISRGAEGSRYRITPFARALIRARAAREAQRAGETKSAEGQTWRAMRMMREFSVIDITASSDDLNEDAVRAYCGALLEAGYLRISRREEPGLRSGYYRLIRDTGPLPPRERMARVVWDDNLCEVVGVMEVAQ